jgi:hypothetical protein
MLIHIRTHTKKRCNVTKEVIHTRTLDDSYSDETRKKEKRTTQSTGSCEIEIFIDCACASGTNSILLN